MGLVCQQVERRELAADGREVEVLEPGRQPPQVRLQAQVGIGDPGCDLVHPDARLEPHVEVVWAGAGGQARVQGIGQEGGVVELLGDPGGLVGEAPALCGVAGPAQTLPSDEARRARRAGSCSVSA